MPINKELNPKMSIIEMLVSRYVEGNVSRNASPETDGVRFILTYVVYRCNTYIKSGGGLL